ncbi:immunity 49 family protein [Gloeobacter kilaueensis]|uniref:Uncharacterized protein n=1 Tax=Gloeobacter kilaueensis (strain ATCC BAA-2537 / CCAP 1431/1 / ULC 316 / JS1) TaxID=1183438 RepID=U5QRB1_GLOK1|nr:immunity 49 family protein [Gloeobacter kilaueensis]AGY60255.1 hypothetical protein GKIL_4009 [Gloeobacter kilaueensis JS1]
MRIPRHVLDLDLLEQGRSYYQKLFDEQKQALGQRLGDPNSDAGAILAESGSTALNLLRYRSVLEPGNRELRSLLDIACLHLGGLFALAAMPAGSGSWGFGLPTGENILLRGTGPTPQANARLWIDSFCLAIVARRDEVLDNLVHLPEPILRHSPVGCPEYMHLCVAALRDLRAGAASTADRVIKALHAASELLAAPKADPSVVQLRTAELEMLAALAGGDGAGFNRFTQKTMTLQRLCWGTRPRLLDPRGWLSIVGLGLVTHAHRQGERIVIRSDYIPEVLVY